MSDTLSEKPFPDRAATPSPTGEPAAPQPTPQARDTRNTGAVSTGMSAVDARSFPVVPGYEILALLGYGGMGVVYKARQLKANRLVALKMIRGVEHAGAHDRLRFQIETEAVARLQHSNIVQLYEVGEVGGLPYFSLEFCPAGTLDRWLKRARPAPNDSAALIETLARAMHYAHLRGVVHRDLKPANVLLSSKAEAGTQQSEPPGDFEPKVTDFGLAKRTDDEGRNLSKSGAIMGTPAYMAPEQAEGKVHDTGPAADVYALGAMLYECLTGQPPFRGETTLDTLHQVLNDEPAAPSRLAPKVPRDLETICLKCLRKAPGQRYASAEALADDLRRFRAGEPIRARRVGQFERGWMWIKRSPLRAALAGLIALLLLALSGVAVGVNDKARLEHAYSQESAARQAETSQRERAEGLVQKQEVLLTEQESLLYANRLLLADQAWSRANASRTEQLLDECPPALRGWEWRYLHRQCHLEVLTLSKHDGYVFTLAVAPKGDVIASGGMDQAARLWNASTGKILHKLDHPKKMVGGVAFSPDGRWLATACGDYEEKGVVYVWDRSTMKRVYEFESPPGLPHGLAFNCDSTLLAVSTSFSSKAEVRVQEWQAGREVWRLSDPAPGYDGVAFHPRDRSHLAVAVGNADFEVSRQKGGIQIWDVVQKKRLHNLTGHGNGVLGVAYSPDGLALVSCSRDQVAKIWNAETGEERVTLGGHQNIIYRAVFSADGSRIATGSEDSTIRLWDAKTGRNLFSIRGTRGAVWSLAYLPDSDRLVSAGEDGLLKVWNADVGREAQSLGSTGDAASMSLAYGPGQVLVAGGIDGKLRIWAPGLGEGPRLINAHADQIAQVAFSPEGKRLASASHDRTFKLWDTLGWRQVARVEADRERLRSVAFDPRGRWLATGGAEGVAKLWDADTGKFVRDLQTHKQQIRQVAFSPDGAILASVSDDNLLKLWDVDKNVEIASRDEHKDVALTVHFSADGRVLLTSGSDSVIHVRDPRTGVSKRVLRGHTSNIPSTAISPDGRRLASASSDNQVKLWDLKSGQEVFTLTLPSPCLGALVFSPDGRNLAAGSDNGVITIWEAPLPADRR